jgi:hypothetical protein
MARRRLLRAARSTNAAAGSKPVKDDSHPSLAKPISASSKPLHSASPDRSGVYNRLTWVFLISTTVVALYYLVIFMIPVLLLNPLPPHTIALATYVPALKPAPTQISTRTQTNPEFTPAGPASSDTNTSSNIQPTATPSKIEFRLTSSNHTIPADVLQEVRVWVGGGNVISGCLDNPPSPILFAGENTVEWGNLMGVLLCGLKPEETVQSTIIRPDGRSTTQDLHARDDGGVSFEYWPALDDLPGQYRFVLDGTSAHVESVTYLVLPTEPRMYYRVNEEALLLYNFLPNERVKILAYKRSGKEGELGELTGWQEYSVDQDGRILIAIDQPPSAQLDYVAVGQQSGQVNRTTDDLNSILFLDSVNPSLDPPRPTFNLVNHDCPGAPSIRVSAGKKARVTFSNGIKVRVRSGPSIASTKTASIPEGTILYLNLGPKCSDGYWWWLASDDNHHVLGWVAEGEPGNYFIEPWQ